MPESTRDTELSTVMPCCGRVVRLSVPFTLVTDPGPDYACIVADQLAVHRAVTVHLATCDRGGG